MTTPNTSAAPRNTEEQLVREVHNADRVPFRAMSKSAQSVLCVEWKAVEGYSRDDCAWVQNLVCPRQWKDEAYRVPPSVFPNNRIGGNASS
jgi:hypothetical protein